MSLQDDAFDIADACKKTCPKACENFVEWAWSMEEENNELLAKVEKLESCFDLLDEQLLKRIAKRRET